ncbi:FAD:protein FMN transferase [Roseisalinus antarcticus]|uniref:FAD:protein FMN transferase n=1 Tax=Roseisalinus antarcticus TaxID=254357 RepID=A0A1Y5TFN1_9RHOB|nr:FAD:protein FMN transferase [Roseisalinus antarcticus]SLN62919.1 Thiamine biosynthesis lipoprotein ApbE precursor [Roseisalinus antarcticus]
MSRISTEPVRHAINGPTMGTRWQATFHAPRGHDVRPIRAAMQDAVAEVDAQMSTWRPESDLMRLNRTAPGVWVDLPARLMVVLAAALEVGRASGGAFDISVGDAVTAWGFGPDAADPVAIRSALQAAHGPAHEVLELDMAGGRSRRLAPRCFDLSGIAKGYGVDRLAEVAQAFGLPDALVAIDGELRALGTQPGGVPRSVAIERPDPGIRPPLRCSR